MAQLQKLHEMFTQIGYMPEPVIHVNRFIKLFEDWAIEDLVENRVAKKCLETQAGCEAGCESRYEAGCEAGCDNTFAKTFADEFADIDDTIAYFKTQYNSIFANCKDTTQDNAQDAKTNHKKRTFTSAFGHETYDTSSIGILYPGPNWNDQIYPSDESDEQSSEGDDTELHTPV